MKPTLVLLLLALIASAYAVTLQESLIFDPFTVFIEVETEQFATVRSSSIVGGQRNIFSQVLGNIDVTVDAFPQLASGEGKTFYSSGSGIESEFIYTYAGTTTADVTTNPCGGIRWLDNCPGSSISNVVGNGGLNLDISTYSGVGFSLLSQDNRNIGTFGVLFMFNDGSSAYATTLVDAEIQSTDPSVPIYFPLAAFGTQTQRNSGVRAILLGVRSTGEALDLSFGPPQFSRISSTKSASRTSVRSGETVDFTVNVFATRFTGNTPTQAYSSVVTIEDVLPEGLVFDSNPIFRENPLAVGTSFATTNNRRFTYTFNIRNGANASITYSTRVAADVSLCNVQLCNTAIIQADITSVNTGNFTFGNSLVRPRPSDTVAFNPRVCVQATANIQFVATQVACQSQVGSDSVSTYQLCNQGTSTSGSISFSQGLTVGCGNIQVERINADATLTAMTVTCINNVCTAQLAGIAPNTCVNYNVRKQCQVSGLCGAATFISRPSFTEQCTTISTPLTCQFSAPKQTQLFINEVVLNEATFFKPDEQITFRITYNGNAFLPQSNALITKVYENNVNPTTVTRGLWTCVDATRTCTRSVAVTTAPQNVDFVVTVNSDFPVALTRTCNNVVIETTSEVALCRATASTTACANVNPGTPNVVIQKRAFASQYTFDINYVSEGSAAATNVVLHEALQTGWVISAVSTAAGWTCNSKQCRLPLGTLASGATGATAFVVDIPSDKLFVQDQNRKCWENTVTSTFDQSEFDTNPDNNCAGAKIGSSCQECCEINCPPTDVLVTIPCPTEATCQFDLPRYYCPPCQVEPAACTCESCPTN